MCPLRCLGHILARLSITSRRALRFKPHYFLATAEWGEKEKATYSLLSGGPAASRNSGLSEKIIIIEPKVKSSLSFRYVRQTGDWSESCDLSVDSKASTSSEPKLSFRRLSSERKRPRLVPLTASSARRWR